MIDVSVNGKTQRVDADPDTPLLWVIRESLGLTGTKYGCGMALCGACTVHLDGAPVRSCVTPVSAARGKRVTTIEGLAQGARLHPVQDAWIEAGRAAVRLLSVRPGHERRRAPVQAEGPDGCGHRRRHEREHLPVRHLPADPRGDQAGRRPDAEGGLTMATLSYPSSPASRREFLKVSATLSSGVLLGFRLPGVTDAAAQTTSGAAATEFAPNAFIRISKGNVVTILVNKAEMGQGVYTSLPMLIAEELEVDLRRVKVVAAPVDPAYNHPVFGMQFTGGSQSIASEWERLRKAGAAAREMLLAAAADIWKVDRASLRAENGAVIGPGGRRLTYGQLAERAATMPVPADPPLKDPSQFKIIGKSTRRLDSRVKVTGEATFGLDASGARHADRRGGPPARLRGDRQGRERRRAPGPCAESRRSSRSRRAWR